MLSQIIVLAPSYYFVFAKKPKKIHQNEPNRLQNEVTFNTFPSFRAGFLPKATMFFDFYTKFGVWKKIFWQKIMDLGRQSQVELTLNMVGRK